MIVAFYEGRPDRAVGRAALEAWCREMEDASWSTPEDIRSRYRSALLVGAERVVFYICDMCRLVARLNYAVGVILVRFVGTPAELATVCVETV